MKRQFPILFAALLVLMIATISFSPQEATALPQAHAVAASPFDERVDLNFGNVPLTTLLNWISGQFDLAFVVQKGLETEPVTGMFRAATIGMVLERSLSARGLAAYRIGETHTCVVMADEAALPADPGAGIDDSALNKTVTLRLRNITIPAYLEALSKQTGMKFSVSGDIRKEKVSVLMNRVTAREALSLLVIGKGLTYRKNDESGVYRVFRAWPELSPIGSN